MNNFHVSDLYLIFYSATVKYAQKYVIALKMMIYYNHSLQEMYSVMLKKKKNEK